MGTQVAEALAALRDLGTPQEMRTLADQGFGPERPPPVNAHIHLPPNFSAFETVQQAVDLAAHQRVGVLGVSNYYDYEVYGDFARSARVQGIFPLFGLEIISMQDHLRTDAVKVNDPGNPGKTYLCGKGITRFDQMTPAAQQLLDLIRRSDRRRMVQMIDRLREIFQARGLAVDLDEKSVIDMVAHRHGAPRETVYLQERHLSQALQQALAECVPAQERVDRLNQILGAETKATSPSDEVAMQNDIRSHLMKAGKPAFVAEAYVSFDEAKRLVLELGGIPSYPTVADGASPICAFEKDPDELIRSLESLDVHAVEWIPPRNSAALLREYVTKMREAGLAVTAGTEHNTLDLIPIEPACQDGPLPDEVRSIFWEGACVVAAHQFLTLRKECGFVDELGNPHREYANDHERIESFARIGAAVIQRYYDACSRN